MGILKISFWTVFVFIMFYIPVLSVLDNIDTNYTLEGSSETVKPGLVVSSPILINDDNDWDALINSGKCTGQGTEGDPYIISSDTFFALRTNWSLFSIFHNNYY